MEGMLVRIASVGRERLSCGGDGKSLVRAIGLQEIEFAGVLGSLRGLWAGSVWWQRDERGCAGVFRRSRIAGVCGYLSGLAR